MSFFLITISQFFLIKEKTKSEKEKPSIYQSPFFLPSEGGGRKKAKREREQAMNGDCAVCGEEVETSGYGWYRQVIGWEEKRRDGGANKISDRLTTGQVKHRACAKNKLHPGQGEMFA